MLALDDGHPATPMAEGFDLANAPANRFKAEQVATLRSVFGDDVPIPDHHFVGPLSFCAHDTDTGKTYIVLSVGSVCCCQTLVHEVGHWMAWTLVPKLAIRANRAKHELWADMCVEAFDKGVTLHNVKALADAFFAEPADD